MWITCTTLRTIREELDRVRRGGGQKTARQLEHLAIRLGRKKHPAAKEPTYCSTHLSELPPLNIPAHGGDLSSATAQYILDQLDEDIVRLNETCEEDEEYEG
ncbi:MAG TPA: hypothetical protein VE974_23355 [Thermoanaerobaculia bacterium]|nr:hypothetical protein [Thermoanaerobaculia bacterium]